jgi:hypothetical protein
MTVEVMMVFSHFSGFPDDWGAGVGGPKSSFVIYSQCNVIAKTLALSHACINSISLHDHQVSRKGRISIESFLNYLVAPS